jgi:hypothetical protein
MTITITRDEIMALEDAVPLGVILYSQTSINPFTKRRSDCSGFASYCWRLPTSGPGTYLGAFNTASLVTEHQMVEIPFADLRLGDAIGYCSPDSPGNGGHIAMWRAGHDPRGSLDVLDHGSGMGPKRRTVKWDGSSRGWLHPDHLKAWRCVSTGEAAPDHPATLVVDGELGPHTITRWQQVMGTPPDGVISWPGPLVRRVQEHLNAHGAHLVVDGKGIRQDGRRYETVAALQRYLGTYVDGYLSVPKSACVEALQRKLNTGAF